MEKRAGSIADRMMGIGNFERPFYAVRGIIEALVAFVLFEIGQE